VRSGAAANTQLLEKIRNLGYYYYSTCLELVEGEYQPIMSELDKLRKKIDAIDDEVLELLNRRSEVVIEWALLSAHRSPVSTSPTGTTDP